MSHWAPPPVQKHVPSLRQPDGHPVISHVCAVHIGLVGVGPGVGAVATAVLLTKADVTFVRVLGTNLVALCAK